MPAMNWCLPAVAAVTVALTLLTAVPSLAPPSLTRLSSSHRASQPNARHAAVRPVLHDHGHQHTLAPLGRAHPRETADVLVQRLQGDVAVAVTPTAPEWRPLSHLKWQLPVPWWAGVLALLALGLASALRPRDPPAPHLTVEDGKAGQRQWAVAVTVAVADKADVPAAAGTQPLQSRDIARCWARSAANDRPLASSNPDYTEDIRMFRLDRGPAGALPLGLDLEEFMAQSNGLGLVLVAEVMPGGAAAALGADGFLPGDAIAAVGRDDAHSIRVEGRNLTIVKDALSRLAGLQNIVVWVKRLVPRASVRLTVVDPFANNRTGATDVLTLPSGRKLQTALTDGGLFDPDDQQMCCGGAGTCGICAVQVEAGGELLSPMADTEAAFLRHSPNRRLACQTRAGNQGGDVTIRLVRPGGR